MTVLVNAATAGRWLDAVMEDQACDLREDALIFNPDSDVNSLFEYAGHLAPDLSGSMVRDLAVLRRTNLRGFRAVRGMVGEVDDFQRRLRGLELNSLGGSPSAAVSRDALRQRLREPLRVLARGPLPACGQPGAARDAALIEVGGVLATVAAGQLAAPSLLADLGAAKTRALRRCQALHDVNGAGALATPGPETTEASGDHERL